MDRCKEIGHLIGPYLYGDLDEGERTRVEAHLASHPECQRRVAETRRSLSALPTRDPRPEELEAIVRGTQAAIHAMRPVRAMRLRWVAALAAACESELDAVVLVVPVTEPALLVERLAILKAQRRALLEAGITRREIETILERVTPRNLRPAVKKERLFFLYGNHDLITPPETVERLWRAWGRPPRGVYPHGHFTLVLFERRLFPEIGRFLELRGWQARAA